MTLYEIDAAILALANEDGEITDYEALDALTMERDRKLENVACWIKELSAEAKAIREEEKSLLSCNSSLYSPALCDKIQSVIWFDKLITPPRRSCYSDGALSFSGHCLSTASMMRMSVRATVAAPMTIMM